jgi:hypothetical protein
MSGERDADDRTPSPAPDADPDGEGAADADGPRRRRLLLSLPAAMAGLAGCSGLLGGGGGRRSPQTAPPAATGEPAAGTDRPGAGPDREPTATATPADTATTGSDGTGTGTETGEGVPTPTQTVAPRPPSDVILMDEEETTVSVFREEFYTAFEASVTLRNVGEVAVSRLAVRIDARYDPPGEPSPFVVASAYVDRNTFAEEGDTDPLFSPGESVRMRLGRDELRFRRDGTADASTDAADYDLAVAFRRVEYGRTDTPSPSSTSR